MTASQPHAPTRGTCDLCDDYGDRLESCSSPLRQFGGHRSFTGPISTFRAFEDNLVLKAILDEPGEGRVLVIDTDASTRVAMLGDNMAGRAVRHGWAGFVVNGAVRDVAALAELPIGVKALASNPRRSRKEGTGARDVVVSFGGATFTPGAVLVSDEDGVVVLPVGEVLALA